MGGRGSAFVNYYNESDSSGVDLAILGDIMDSMDSDEDTKLPHSGYTDLLKQKNVHIKESTDNISEKIIVPNATKIHNLINEYTKTSKELKRSDEELRVRADKMPSNTEAMFVHSPVEFNDLQMVYNADAKYLTRERLERNTQEQIDHQYWTKSDNDELVNHTITHEYGHFVQRVLMEREIRTDKTAKARHERLLEDLEKANGNNGKIQRLLQSYSEECATRYIKGVQRVCRKNFGRDYEKTILSRYGATNNREYFAEIFCNAETNKNPNDIGKAMKIYLKKRLK